MAQKLQVRPPQATHPSPELQKGSMASIPSQGLRQTGTRGACKDGSSSRGAAGLSFPGKRVFRGDGMAYEFPGKFYIFYKAAPESLLSQSAGWKKAQEEEVCGSSRDKTSGTYLCF